MKEIWFIFFSLIAAHGLGQETINHRYPLGPQSVATSVFALDSNFLIVGYVSDTIPSFHLKTFVASVGYDGELGWVKTYGDEDNEMFPVDDASTEIGDSLIVLGLWGGSDGVTYSRVMWLNHQGDSIRSTKCYSPYLDLDSEDIHDWNQPIAMASDELGNIFLASTIDSSGFNDVLLTSLDFDGNEVWKNVIHYSEGSHTCRALRTNQDGILAGIGIPDPDGVGMLTRIVQYSTEGEFLFEYMEESFGIDVSQPRELVQLMDERIIIGSSESAGFLLNRPIVYSIDEDGFEWFYTQGSDYHQYQRFGNIIETIDGNIVALGQDFVEFEEPDEINGDWNEQAILTKLTPEGDLIWSRSIYLVASQDDSHRLFDLKECPDGGLVFCGFASDGDTENPDNEAPYQRVWVVKTDACGCLIPGCDPDCQVDTGVTHIVYTDSHFVIGPNPVHERLYVHLVDSAPQENRWFELFDQKGKLVKRFNARSGQTTYVLPTDGLAQGLMVLSLIEEGRIVQSEKVMIR